MAMSTVSVPYLSLVKKYKYKTHGHIVERHSPTHPSANGCIEKRSVVELIFINEINVYICSAVYEKPLVLTFYMYIGYLSAQNFLSFL